MIENNIIDRNNNLIKSYQKQYKSKNVPIEVKFREIIPELKSADRYTHLIHSYPAKLLVHIPYFFLNNSVLSKLGDNVLDPFNGTGTVYLESLLAGRNAFGADSNPLARLISKVKSTKYDTKILSETLDEVINKAIISKEKHLPDVVNCDLWFSKRNKVDLSKILFQINKIENENIRNFMLVSFSNCVKKVSYADPRISVPVRLNAEKYHDKPELKEKTIKRINEINTVNIFEKFKTIANDNIKRFKKLENTLIQNYQSNYISRDARNLFNCNEEVTPLPNDSIQLIITSPPYAGAQKYIRSSSLNLGWTGLAKVSELSMLDKKNIGRDIYTKNEINIVKTGIQTADLLIEKIALINISRANIACKYLIEMKVAIDEMIRVLKKEGNLVLVIGNNKICGFEFNTQAYLTEYITNKGLNLQFKLIDDIASYGLMTKRNKTADIISREYILVFKK
ncbi:DNA methyltransferase [Flavobacterium faecale]|uniref:DNA methyltransferase n=1 Tax=Flavobacterium faecale TaxID=1355330 RepID=UPI003AB096F9